jgi:hypothetical protein
MIAVGVDTHKEQHLAVALDDLGQLLTEITITTNLAGYRELVDWLAGLDGQVLLVHWYCSRAAGTIRSRQVLVTADRERHGASRWRSLGPLAGHQPSCPPPTGSSGQPGQRPAFGAVVQ